MISPQKSGIMKKHVICIFLALVLPLWLAAPVNAEQSCQDLLGVDFFSDLVFFGESTTTHLRQRSPLAPTQIWANSSGTARLDSNLAYRPVVDPQSGKSVPLAELAKQKQPCCIVLSFGLNGITSFSTNVEDYLQKYQKLMDDILQVSPNTHFLIQSIYPVAEANLQQNWGFNATPTQINEKINHLNQSLKSYCLHLKNADFIDTSCNLKDGDGFLRAEYTTDGIHLTKAAYQVILKEIASKRKDQKT